LTVVCGTFPLSPDVSFTFIKIKKGEGENKLEKLWQRKRLLRKRGIVERRC